MNIVKEKKFAAI